MKQYDKQKRLLEKVYNTIRKYDLVEAGEGIVTGVSGGPDSVCLLHVLHSLVHQLDIRIFAVHINHMLRGDESLQDEEYVGELCRKLDIPLFVSKQDVKGFSERMGISLEEAGRDIRYSLFEKFAAETGASKIAVAHNKNDQAETVLMNMIRGSGLDGLKGMDYKSGKVIRPLLDTKREDIEFYCEMHSLSPRTDRSNLEEVYTRNRIRLNLIPGIDRLFDINTVDILSRMASVLKADHDFIEKSSLEQFDKFARHGEDGTVSIHIRDILGIHPALAGRVLRHAIKLVKGNLKGIESVHIESIMNLCLSGRTGLRVVLPQGITAARSYELLRIGNKEEAKSHTSYDIPVNIPGITRIEELGSSVEASIQKSPDIIVDCSNIRYNSLVQYFDYDKLKSGINIRNRRDGDIFKPLKSTGTKKLKEYFIDKKVPRDERDGIPLIASAREIVWIIGHKTSDKFKVTENTKTVLKMEYKPWR